MALNIRHRETEELAAAVAELAGETKTEAVRRALQDRLDRLQRSRSEQRRVEELDDIARRCASLPLRDDRPADEVLGYDEHGLPT